jgi:hypothetical protein
MNTRNGKKPTRALHQAIEKPSLRLIKDDVER